MVTLFHIKKSIAFTPFVFLFGFFAIVVSGIFLPIYSDEVVVKWALGRFFIDDLNMLSFFPQCSSSLSYPISPIFYPAAAIYSSIYGNVGPLGIRLSGVFLALAWLLGIAYWTSLEIKDNKSRIYLTAGFLSLAGLGVTPYLLVMSRAEQVISISLVFLCLSVVCLRKLSLGRTYYTFIAAFLILVSCFFFVHPKTVFFVPAVIFVAFHIGGKRGKILQVALCAFVLAAGYQSYRVGGILAKCTDAPIVLDLVKYNVISPTELLDSPGDFIKKGLDNIYNAPDRIISHVLFQPAYQSGWLPSIGSLANGQEGVNIVISLTLKFLLIGSHIAILMLFLVLAIRRISKPLVCVGLLISIGSLGNMFLYRTWNFYGAGQLIPISIILLAIFVFHFNMKKYSGILKGISILLMSLSIYSCIILVGGYLPVMIANSSTIEADIPGQPLSISIFKFDEHISRIHEVANICRVPTDPSKRLVVDHMTYFAFTRFPSPIHILYVSEEGFGRDLADGKLMPFLKGIHTAAIIARCSYMPPQLYHMSTIKRNGYCCINLSDGQ